MAERLDRCFFREAYQSELILGELNETVQTMIDESAMLDTVGTRISESLHVPRIAILLTREGQFTPAYAVGLEGRVNLALSDVSFILNKLQTARDLGQIYWDIPTNWIYRAPSEQIAAIRSIRAQLLLPITVRERLLGVLSLGPKRSEEPYSNTDLRLLRSIASQMGFTLENSRLSSAVALEIAQREKLNQEVEIAREVQQRLFPHELPLFLELDYFGSCRSAQGVGGDYYDFLKLGDDALGIAIGDVSGKGIAAALLMASLQASLCGQALQRSSDLTAVLATVNRLVFGAASSNRYATFFYAQYDRGTRKLTYVNAGHNPPIILRRTEEGLRHVIRLETGGAPIGLFREAPYQQASLTLEPGDILVGFTDRTSEAMNMADEEWGEHRLFPMLHSCSQKPAREMIPTVMAAADKFTGGAPQNDDMTLVVLKFER